MYFLHFEMIKRRHSIRLKNYDYSKSGLYFVTICTQNRECLFCDIINGKMVLNSMGKIVGKLWKILPNRFPIILDVFQIMPNHVHMIVNIVGAGFIPAHGFISARNDERATTRVAPTTTNAFTITLGNIIGAFKSLTTHE